MRLKMPFLLLHPRRAMHRPSSQLPRAETAAARMQVERVLLPDQPVQVVVAALLTSSTVRVGGLLLLLPPLGLGPVSGPER